MSLRPGLSTKMLIVTWANFLKKKHKKGKKKKKKTKKKVRTINIVRVSVKVSPAEGRRHLHTNTAYARLLGV